MKKSKTQQKYLESDFQKEASGDDYSPDQPVLTIVDDIPPTLTLDEIFPDSIINAQEHKQPLVISGTTDAEDGQIVVVNVNDRDYKVEANYGIFCATVPAKDVGKFTDEQKVVITANFTDALYDSAPEAKKEITVDISIKAEDDLNTIEEESKRITGNILGNDDANSIVTTIGAVAGKYGLYFLKEDGDYEYNLYNNMDAVQGLGEGSSIVDEISYSIKDAAGNTATAKLTTTITGVNDVPVINAIIPVNINENDGKVTGTITSKDKDTGDIIKYSISDAAAYPGFSLAPNGAYEFNPMNLKFKHLAEGAKDNISIPITATDNNSGVSWSRNLVIDITGINDAPTVIYTDNDLSNGIEDIPLKISTSDLLRRVKDVDDGAVITIKGSIGAFETDENSLVTSKSVGTVTGPDSAGDYTFTSIPNFKGYVTFKYTVEDEHAESVVGTARAVISEVSDSADASLNLQVDGNIINFMSGGGALMNIGPLKTQGIIDNLAVEFTVVEIDSASTDTATFISYAHPTANLQGSFPQEFYVTNPTDLTIWLGGTAYTTGIDTTAGLCPHRYNILWEKATGHLDVLVDGVVKHQQDDVAKSLDIKDSGILVLGQNQTDFKLESLDSTSHDHGFLPENAFIGKMSNASLANAKVGPDDLKDLPLAMVAKSNGLVINMLAGHNANSYIDTTHKHDLQDENSIGTIAGKIDASVTTLENNSNIYINIVAKAHDHYDAVTKEAIVGLVKDTVLTDGTNTHTITGTSDKVDVHNWEHDKLTATLPSITANMSVALVVETKSANTNTPSTTVQVNKPLILFENVRPAPIVLYDEDHEIINERLMKTDTYLVGVNKELEIIGTEINELKEKSEDATEAEDYLNNLANAKEELLAEKETLESGYLMDTMDTMDTNADDKSVANENYVNIIPETESPTLNLDDVADRVVVSGGPVVESSVNSEALNKVSSLLGDGNSDAENIIKVIEEREIKENIVNPYKPSSYDDVSSDIAADRYMPNYIPDVNSPTPLDDYDAETYAV